MSEQRIMKSVSGEVAIHYHYDAEGRLIAETDASTGENRVLTPMPCRSQS